MLPSPRLERLTDETGLTVFQYMKMAPGRVYCDVVLVKACLSFSEDGIEGPLQPSDFILADTHFNPDAPLGSSLETAGDVVLGKPGADVLVTGTARSASMQRAWPVEVSVHSPGGDSLVKHDCMATGQTRWQYGRLSGWALSDPEPTQAVPIRYELAYGGRKPDPQRPEEEWEGYEANPSGTGFSLDHHAKTDTPDGPQWLSGGHADLRSGGLVGLGPVARFWSDRARHAGIYDDAWKAAQQGHAAFDYGRDFDWRFFHSAHPGLRASPAFKGDESIRLAGLLPMQDGAPWTARLPGWGLHARCDSPLSGTGTRTAFLPLDTLHIDLDARRIHLVWRLVAAHGLNIDRAVLRMEKL